MSDKRICIGAITGAHGIKGEVKVKSFTTVPEDIGSYSPLEDESGNKHYELKATGLGKGVVRCKIKGIETRNDAEALKGTRFYVDRSALPAPQEEEYYHVDLIGLDVFSTQGHKVGTLKAVYNFGAGEIIEITPDDGGDDIMVPFTRKAVPAVEIEAGRVVVSPFEEIDVIDENEQADAIEEGTV